MPRPKNTTAPECARSAGPKLTWSGDPVAVARRRKIEDILEAARLEREFAADELQFHNEKRDADDRPKTNP
jgi:hypothetical protein